MLLETKGDLLAKKILTAKLNLVNEGKRPRLVLLGEKEYKELEDDWIGSVKDLPWGDSLVYELERRKDKSEVFLADGTIHGLWIVKVNTIEGFKVC